MTDNQGTTWKQDIDRVQAALRDLWPPFGQSPHDDKRNNVMWLLHSSWNVLVEATRRNPQAAAKIIVFGFPLLILLVEWQ